jgi:hypothetical protein
MNQTYGIHPSKALCDLFASMPLPYQGQDPYLARAIFVGLDANYAPELFDYPDFRDRILEYHRDGAAFWRRHQVHHPFMLKEYPLKRNSGGVPYHRKFANMGLGPEYADKISFVELLPVPTTGSTDRGVFWQLFSVEHGRRLDALFDSSDHPRAVLLPKSAVDFMLEAKKRYDLFTWLSSSTDWGPIGRVDNTAFFQVRHFSGSISKDQINDIGQIVRSFCATSSPR